MTWTGSALSYTFRLDYDVAMAFTFRWGPACLPSALLRTFDTPLWRLGSLLPAGVCYRALQGLPGRDFHPLEQRVFQDAPWIRLKVVRRRQTPTALRGERLLA